MARKKSEVPSSHKLNDNELLSMYRRIKAIPQLSQKLPTKFQQEIETLNTNKKELKEILDDHPGKEVLENEIGANEILSSFKPSHESAFLTYLPLRNFFIETYSIEEVLQIEDLLIEKFFNQELGDEFKSWLKNADTHNTNSSAPTTQKWPRHTLAYERASNVLGVSSVFSFLAIFISLLLAIKLCIFGLILLGTPAGVPLLIAAAVFVGIMVLAIGFLISLAVAVNLLDSFHKNFENRHADKIDIEHPGLFSMTAKEIAGLGSYIDPLATRIALIECREELARIGWPHGWSTKLFNNADYKKGQEILQRVEYLKAHGVSVVDSKISHHTEEDFSSNSHSGAL